MKKSIVCLMLIFIVWMTGCQPKTTYIDRVNDQGKPVMQLDYRDFDQSASKLVQSMLGSGALEKKGGGRYVVATGRITNDTMQRIDTSQLMAKIETELLRSGKAVMTSAVGSRSDSMVHESRELRYDEEFDPNSIAAKKTLIAPELSMSGKIYQRNIRYDNDKQQVEYYFQLQLTNVRSGLRYWQDEVFVGKRGSNKSVAW